MLCLANDILDFAQFEAKRLVLNINDDLDIRSVFNECISVLNLKAEYIGIRLNSIVL